MASRGLLIPPNFGYVEENFYRCGVPTVLSFPFLERLKLKTNIYLAPDEPSEVSASSSSIPLSSADACAVVGRLQAFLNFVKDQEIRLVHLGEERNFAAISGPWNPIGEDMVI